MTNFKVSHGWVWRFAIRERLSILAVTTSGHTMPSDGKGNFEWWVELHETNTRVGVVVGEGNAGNMDQTAHLFAMPNKKSYAPIGAIEVPAKNTGHTKLRFTVQLCAMDDALLLDSLVIFKGLTEVPPDCKNIMSFQVLLCV